MHSSNHCTRKMEEMMHRRLVCLIVLTIIGCGLATANPLVEHIVMLPLMEGTGIAASITTLTQAENGVTKAAAVSNLAALGLNAAIGTVDLFLPPEAKYPMRIVHRIVGYVTAGLSIWLAVSDTLDPGTNGEVSQGLAFTYSATTAFPLIAFRF